MSSSHPKRRLMGVKGPDGEYIQATSIVSLQQAVRGEGVIPTSTDDVSSATPLQNSDGNQALFSPDMDEPRTMIGRRVLADNSSRYTSSPPTDQSTLTTGYGISPAFGVNKGWDTGFVQPASSFNQPVMFLGSQAPVQSGGIVSTSPAPHIQGTGSIQQSQQRIPVPKWRGWTCPNPVRYYGGNLRDLECFLEARNARPRSSPDLNDNSQASAVVNKLRSGVRYLFDAIKQTDDVIDEPITKRGVRHDATALKRIRDGHWSDDLIWKAAWRVMIGTYDLQAGGTVGAKITKENETTLSDSITVQHFPNYLSRLAATHRLFWFEKSSCKRLLDAIYSNPEEQIYAQPEEFSKAKERNQRANNKRKKPEQHADDSAPEMSPLDNNTTSKKRKRSTKSGKSKSAVSDTPIPMPIDPSQNPRSTGTEDDSSKRQRPAYGIYRGDISAGSQDNISSQAVMLSSNSQRDIYPAENPFIQQEMPNNVQGEDGFDIAGGEHDFNGVQDRDHELHRISMMVEGQYRRFIELDEREPFPAYDRLLEEIVISYTVFSEVIDYGTTQDDIDLEFLSVVTLHTDLAELLRAEVPAEYLTLRAKMRESFELLAQLVNSGRFSGLVFGGSSGEASGLDSNLMQQGHSSDFGTSDTKE